MKRVLTALILGPLIAAIVLWGPPYVFLPVLVIVALLCFHEYLGIVAAYGIRLPAPLGYVAGLLVLLVPSDPFLLLTLATLLALSLALSARNLADGLPQAAILLLGIVYIFGAWRFAKDLWFRDPYWLLFALLLNWVSDSAAYYIGCALGRHKLAPRISPAKSWEGAIASLVASLLFGFFYLRALLPVVSVPQILVLSAVGNLAGQIGDLAESALKRGAGVKDSGNWLPGHGGWLDRVDSTLFTLPVIYGVLSLPWRS